MNNILITGANGQLGQEIKSLNHLLSETNFFYTDKEDLNITKLEEIDVFVNKNKITSIINCAAYTAVDKAEDEFEIADSINHKAAKNLALISKKYNLKFIHISTDYVFSGESYIPYTINHKAEPKSVYGDTKLKGELAIKELNPLNTIIIRTAWVYSEFGANFVKTMLRLGKEREELGIIYDQIGSPTYANDLARAILNILPQINLDTVETYHFTNEGVCSWYDFAKSIFEIKNIECKVSAIPTSAYPTKATRPYYSILDKQKIKDDFNVEIPYWRDSLKKCLQKL